MARWHPPGCGKWMVNCDAAVKGNNAAFAFVVCDDTGLLVVARTKLTWVSSIYEAETKAIEWAASYADDKTVEQTCFFYGCTDGGQRNCLSYGPHGVAH